MTTQETLDRTEVRRPDTSEQVRPAVEAFLAMHESIRTAAGIYAEDAVLDMNVPRWRFQIHGPSAITDGWAEAFPSGFALGDSRWEPTSSGAVVEYDGYDVARGHYYRHLVLLELDAGRISRTTVYCTGGWSAERVQDYRHEAATGGGTR
jgi:hypothetical protein